MNCIIIKSIQNWNLFGSLQSLNILTSNAYLNCHVLKHWSSSWKQSTIIRSEGHEGPFVELDVLWLLAWIILASLWSSPLCTPHDGVFRRVVRIWMHCDCDCDCWNHIIIVYSKQVEDDDVVDSNVDQSDCCDGQMSGIFIYFCSILLLIIFPLFALIYFN